MIESLYLHIPFCSYKCPYCDFVSVVGGDVREYVNALKREVEFYKDEEVILKTLYFGGGTPTLLKPEEIGALIEHITSVFPYREPLEITVECNPETYSYKEFKRLNSYGVNRLSVGVQSFTTKGLRALGRVHTPQDSVRTILGAKEAGIDNLSVDIIYAYPQQREEDALAELEALEKLPLTHVSAYMLTAYENTPMGKLIRGGLLATPKEEELERIYNRLWRGLKELGFVRYEISNWAKEGKVCRHNLNYWKRREFIGLGVSAWGFIRNRRYGNFRNLGHYLETVIRGKRPVGRTKSLGKREAVEEEVFLSLRLCEGIVRDKINVPERLYPFLEFSQERVAIKEEFMLLADEIISEILAALDT